jgi:hypothetical protein
MTIQIEKADRDPWAELEDFARGQITHWLETGESIVGTHRLREWMRPIFAAAIRAGSPSEPAKETPGALQGGEGKPKAADRSHGHDLLPCPFCGSPATFVPDNSYGACGIGCLPSCAAEPYVTSRVDEPEKAVALWNARAVPQARSVPVEAVAQILADEFYGGFDPFQKPERWDYLEQIAKKVLALFANPDQLPIQEKAATAADYNALFDPADEAGQDTFANGFREGFLYSRFPDGYASEEAEDALRDIEDIAIGEAWEGYRDEFFRRLPIAALPPLPAPPSEVGK